MISRSGVERLVDELRFAGGRPAGVARPVAAPSGAEPPDGSPWQLDFASAETWPDLPYDTASAASRYDGDAQAKLRDTLATAGARMAAHVPAARAFAALQLDGQVLLRHSERVAAAASGSNRTAIGGCVLTNLHLAPDPVPVAIEALVHESIHQRLYRLEAAEGAFCDLGGPPVLRSPWTGSRLPLHSLVHATFVWFGLAMMWQALGRRGPGDAHADERLAYCRFGFQFLADVTEASSFPHASVADRVRDAMRSISAEVLRSETARR